MTKSRMNSWITALLICMSLPVILRAEPSTAAQGSSDADDAVPPRGGQGTVKIITTPEKAVAYMDGVKLGLTPIDTSFQSGRYTLVIMLNGEELVHERVNIWPNKDTTIEKHLLMPYGSVAIKADPLKVNYHVYVDGEEVGTTKGGVLTINKLEAGTRVIRLTNGKRSKEQNVDILPEQTIDLVVDFKKK
jgi:PEGA domain